MKIFIQARKNGYNVLYPPLPTPTEFYHFGSDLQSDSAKNNAIYKGKNFYTLAFSNGGCIFTKYLIGYDIQRGDIGNIGISVFIPDDKKLVGNLLKTLLDDLLNIYSRNYCPDYQIGDEREDWVLFTSLANSYDKHLESHTYEENIKSGTLEPAFHYYKSVSELVEHFDNPFQSEYQEYKQILFIEESLRDNANPLDVIKNSGKEVNPDLKNEYFYLNNSDILNDVNITANGNRIFGSKGNNKIRAKWVINLNYTKDYRCYEPINATGTLADTRSDIYNYLGTKGNQVFFKKDAFDKPQETTVNFVIKDYNGNEIEGAEIKIGDQPWENVNESCYSYKFFGEEIVKEMNISARKLTENLNLSSYKVIPFENNAPVVLKLQKQIAVKIFATEKESGDVIQNFKYWCSDGKGYRSNENDLIFTNDEINQTYTIEVEENDGKNKFIGNTKYFPAKGVNPIYIQCEKKAFTQPSPNKYKIDAGVYGAKTKDCPEYSTSKNGNDINKKYIEPKKGYLFDYWSLQNNTIVAQYKPIPPKKINLILIASTITFILSIVILFFLFMTNTNKINTKNQQTRAIIYKYLEGEDFNLDKLNSYKEDWDKIKEDYNNKSDGWKDLNDSIERAIRKREWINNFDFDKLKNDTYSKSQNKFLQVINKIDSSNKKQVSSHLSNISYLSLTQIADSINNILRRIDSKTQKTPVVSTNVGLKERDSITIAQNQNKGASNVENPNILLPNKDTEIIKIIKGSDFKKNDLNGYMENAIDKTLKKSIELCLEFWIIDKSKKDSYIFYVKKLKVDNILKNSKLKNFVEQVANGNDKSLNLPPVIDFNTKPLSEIIKNLNQLNESN